MAIGPQGSPTKQCEILIILAKLKSPQRIPVHPFCWLYPGK